MNNKTVLYLLVAVAVIIFSLFAIHTKQIADLTEEMNNEIAAKEDMIKEKDADLKTIRESLAETQEELTNQELNNERLINDMLYMTKVNQELIDKNKELDDENKYLSEISEYIYNYGWSYDYSEYDIRLLAGVMFGECEDSGRLEQAFVGSVVLNRVLSPLFPNNVHDVVYQFDGKYEQYAPRTKRIAEAVVANEPISKSDADVRYLPDYYFELAEILLKYGPMAPPEVVYQAHFNQGKVFWNWQGEEFCYK
jgi:hypothetical protein